MTGPNSGSRSRGSSASASVRLLRSRKVSRSPLPENRVPRAGPRLGKAARLRSSRKVEPNVPAPMTSRSAVTVTSTARAGAHAGAAPVRARVGARGVPVGVADPVLTRCGVPVDPPHLAQGADHRPGVVGPGQVGVVEGVLRAVVAAKVALAAQAAGKALLAVQVRVLLGEELPGDRGLARAGEADRERRQHPVQAERLGGVAGRPALGGRRVGRHVERVALHAHHGLGGLIVRFKVGIADRPRPGRLVGRVVDEPGRVLAEHDVGVDEGAAAEAAAHHGLDAAERPHVEHPVQPGGRCPQVGGQPAGAARERAWRVTPAAFEDQHRPPGLGKPARRRRRAEA